MKRGILAAFALVLFCALLLSVPKADAATQGACGENVTWTLDDTGTMTISGTGLLAAPMFDSWWGEFADPAWESNRQAVKKVVINEGITAIGDNAFRAFYNLETIEIPASVTEIYWDFARDSGVKTITFKGACPKLKLSEHHDNCGDWLCDGGSCGSLCGVAATVYYPAGDSSYASAMDMEFCSAITWQTSTSATVVASGTCGANLRWTLDDQGTLTISGTGAMWDWAHDENAPWCSECASIKKIVFGNRVTTIGDYAFYSCDSLTSVTIPDNVISIGALAFSGCTGLTSVTIPDSVTTIGGGAFSNTAWYNNQPDGLVYAGKLAYKYKGTCPSSVTLKEGTLGIAADAFRVCDGLISVTIPDGVTTIDDYAFSWCFNLTSVTIPGSMRTIDDHAFYYCDNLTSVTYCGTKDQWDRITIAYDNYALIYAERYYHSFSEATCTTPKTCTLCGATEGELGEHCGDIWFEITKVTCTTAGLKARICENCGETEVVTVPALGHSYNESITQPNCTTEGSRVQTCAVCGHTVTEVIPAKGHKWSAWVRLSAPTCSADGSQLRFCNCGTSETQAIPAMGHSYENGICTACGAAEIQLFDIDVARMILGNALEFQFGVATSKIPDKTGYYAVIEKTWADGTTTEKIIPADQWGESGAYWAIVYDGLAAKEMGDTFFVTIYSADGVAISNAKEDSVRAYVARAYASQSATGKTMMVDMLCYGAAAQLHFGYGTNDLANSKLTAAQLATGTATAPTMENNQVKGTNYSGSRFILESRIQVQLAFKNLTSDMHAIYTYTNASGKAQTVRVEGKDFVVIGGKPAGVELSQLVYADARGQVTVMVYNADGTLHGMAIDSIESCAYRSSGDVFAALMQFADSAKKHLYG